MTTTREILTRMKGKAQAQTTATLVEAVTLLGGGQLETEERAARAVMLEVLEQREGSELVDQLMLEIEISEERKKLEAMPAHCVPTMRPVVVVCYDRDGDPVVAARYSAEPVGTNTHVDGFEYGTIVAE